MMSIPAPARIAGRLFCVLLTFASIEVAYGMGCDSSSRILGIRSSIDRGGGAARGGGRLNAEVGVGGLTGSELDWMRCAAPGTLSRLPGRIQGRKPGRSRVCMMSLRGGEGGGGGAEKDGGRGGRGYGDHELSTLGDEFDVVFRSKARHRSAQAPQGDPSPPSEGEGKGEGEAGGGGEARGGGGGEEEKEKEGGGGGGGGGGEAMEGVSVEEEHEQGEDAMEDDDGGEIGVDALTKRLAGEVDQLMARGESDATEELLEKAVEENPGQVGPMLLYAEFLWRVRKDRQGADDMYHAACETAPNFADAHEVRGQFLLEAGDTKGAVEAMRLAVSLAPPDGQAAAILWYNLGHVSQLMASDGTPGACAESEEAYRKAIELNPGLSRAFANLAALLHQHGRNQTESEELFVASLKAEPNNTVALVGYGRLLAQMLDLEKADLMYQTACEVLGDGIVGGEDCSEEYPSILAEYAAFLSSNIGEEGVEKVDDIFGFLTENAIIDEYGASAYVKHLGRTGRHAKAVAVMENLTASEQFGSEAWTHAVLGDALLAAGEKKAARKAWRASLSRSPGCHRALQGLTKVLRPDHVDDIDLMEELSSAALSASKGSKDKTIAIEILRAEFAARQTGPRAFLGIDIIEEAMRDGAEESGPAMIAHAKLLYKLGERQRAISCLRRAEILRPEDPDVLTALGDALLESEAEGAYKDAGAYYEQALMLAPKTIKAHHGLGVVHLHERRWDEARRHLSLVLEEEPNNLHAARDLGLLLAERSEGPEDYDKAVQLLKMVQKANPDDQAVWNALYPYTRQRGAGKAVATEAIGDAGQDQD